MRRRNSISLRALLTVWLPSSTNICSSIQSLVALNTGRRKRLSLFSTSPTTPRLHLKAITVSSVPIRLVSMNIVSPARDTLKLGSQAKHQLSPSFVTKTAGSNFQSTRRLLSTGTTVYPSRQRPTLSTPLQLRRLKTSEVASMTSLTRSTMKLMLMVPPQITTLSNVYRPAISKQSTAFLFLSSTSMA